MALQRIAGMLLRLLPGRLRGRPWLSALLRLLALGAGAAGALALAGYAVRASLLFPGYIFGEVAAPAAFGLILLAAALWAMSRELPGGRATLLLREDDRIAFAGATVLFAVAAATGLATFAVLQDKVLSIARESVLASQARRAETFVDFIELRESNARIAATRPAALRNLRAIEAGRDDGSNLANLNAVVASFVREGFSGIAYLDAGGRTVAGGGAFTAAPAIVAPLATPGKAELLWNGGYVLRHRIALRDAEGELGSLLAEQPMRVLTRLSQDTLRLGETGDMGLCFREGEGESARHRCFPERFNPKVFSTASANADGQPLPMTHALRSETGTVISRDYRGRNVVAAYGPVGALGLGMVVKIDAAEIFAPVRQQLLPAAAILLLLAAAGALLLRARVKPLAARLVDLNQDLNHRGAELEAANRELEAFSYSVSHDLRAPLRHISGFTDMLKEDCAGKLDESGLRYLKIISEAAARMGTLIDDLLSFSRMGRVDMHRGRFSSAELVKEVLAQIESETRGRRIEWTIDGLPEALGDRALLRQVWVNLLSNAVKYTGRRETAKISVSFRRDKGELVFCVQDNGAGFEMEFAGKLFGVFQRLHRQDQFEGTGIGLANVRRIVARHGGRTWAEGRKDEGASFYFTLPDIEESPT
jgi:signal transduction histidine kinase